jgi:mitogen-activated protein kinase kinase kinase 1
MRKAQQQYGQESKGSPAPGVVASPASSFRQLDDAFLQKQTKIWLGEVLHLRFDEDILVADLLGDGELLFQVSKLLWKRLLRKNNEQLKQSKVYMYERTSFGKSNGKYMPYPKVDSFLKICQILGLAGIDLFTPSDVVDKRNVRKVCMCIRSLSKKASMMHLNVPDFDIVTRTIAMPNYIVGGIRKSLEQPQRSSSWSSGHSPRANSESIFGEQNGDTQYDSDEAESKIFPLEPQNSVGEDDAAELLQLGKAHKEAREGYGDNGHDIPEEKSLAESVGSLDFGGMDMDSVDSAPSQNDQLRRCSAESSTNGHLVFDSSKIDLDAPTAEVSEMIRDGHIEPSHYSVEGSGERFADNLQKEGDNDLQKDTSTTDQQCDAPACDRESVCSSCEEPKLGLNGEPPESRLSSESGLTPGVTMGGQLPAASEDDTTSQGLKHEISTGDHMDSTKSEDKTAKPQDTVENKNTDGHKTGNSARKPGNNGVLKSVAGGITLVGVVFFIAHLRRTKGASFTAILPSLSKKSVQSDSRAKNVDNGKTTEVYPGGWLKV